MMKPHVVLACIATTAIFGVGSASAAGLRVSTQAEVAIHISVAGKSDDQVRSEIRTAAVSVCGHVDQTCINMATDSGYDQLAKINASRKQTTVASNKVDVERIDVASIRVPVAGRSPAEIQSDIHIAAKKVCAMVASSVTDNSGCVRAAVSDAQSQLQAMVQTETGAKVASK